ncbi:hypothetical protein Adeh_3701 [Anaeromyxobacter dehalogenans 2CP-C]|uniref:Uncharacterized protein n=1 Tax=Anaeromyxobacter dehalogenans (strain 2CP-C) TaxID=290397 RepID=Q2IFV8_ANADE|nr:hypothetical protein Adeh_3701 [Anaeromyxobacter dehalogenans 2CP-C]
MQCDKSAGLLPEDRDCVGKSHIVGSGVSSGKPTARNARTIVAPAHKIARIADVDQSTSPLRVDDSPATHRLRERFASRPGQHARCVRTRRRNGGGGRPHARPVAQGWRAAAAPAALAMLAGGAGPAVRRGHAARGWA